MIRLPFKNTILSSILKKRINQIRLVNKKPFETQKRNFKYLINKGENTKFGSDHFFQKIKNYTDFSDKIPVRNYEDLFPYIEEIRSGGENILWPRQLIIHEVMGRHCGWLTAATAFEYRKRLQRLPFIDEINMCREKWDVHAVLLPEDEINFDKECERLNKIMNKYDCVNIFLCEGAGQQLIIDKKIKKDEYIAKDAFGHIRLDDLDAGKWFANEFSKRLNANKILIQKSGYFSRSSKPNKKDLDLIIKCSDKAVESAVNGISGVIGLDEDDNNKLTSIDFSRIKGGKPFDINQIWFTKMMEEIKNI